MAAGSRSRERPNALAVGFLFMLVGLAALADAVEGVGTIVFMVAALPIFGVIAMLTVGLGDVPKAAKPVPVQRSRPPRAVAGPATRVVQNGREWRVVVRQPLPRGRIVSSPVHA